MASLPICLIIGTGEMNTTNIVQGILGESNEVSEPRHESGRTFYKWDISTKYYSATIDLCQMTEKTLVSEEFASNVNAAVIYFDCNQTNGLEEVNQWLPFMKEFNPEIKIIVCDQCLTEENSTVLSRYNVQKWCIEHGFELVELNPSDEIDPEDDFPETLGMQRIIQALHAHSWPNLILRSSTDVDRSRIEHLSRLLLGENVMDSSLDSSSLDASALDALNDDSDGAENDIESFEALFQQLCSMKNRASNLAEGSTERKAYAEKVTMAFWRAMKGDEQEIEGLDSSDQE